ncbi:hypothetical protein GCM10010988_39220 [Cnuibacter physcomitrellae]|uniref:Uncharacterized protein n=1 Tax=Cnuibacter physcomitrellae TaxID=1619308 RepID=A0A1X9LQT3_9MICO|nr:hypothetical protein [Cnuibacter physcomitrellae]ARJ07543.1 hypothetical protein B5808_19275 [Cnuibacter physcomitrellae]GGI42476.1 hypothetical protein GCM10010988_39220 [Cnuibacter physcomitrellae]
MPVFDSPGALLTSIALLIVTVAVVFYLLTWAIRLGVRRALRDHHTYVTLYESMPVATGATRRGPRPDAAHDWEAQP